LRTAFQCLLPPLLVLALTACSTVPTLDVDESERISRYEARSGRLALLGSWTLEGRLAVRGEEEGGSGSFNWSRTGSTNRMDFYGAFGRGAWRLAADDSGAVLERADGSVYRAGSIDELVRSEVGWEIPVGALGWWARGMAAPGGFSARTLDEAGRLIDLEQGGWTIEYGRYRAFGDLDLPVKVVARSPEWQLKLAIREWELPPDGSGQ
jgi:outer membrane lipoprotein LolB